MHNMYVYVILAEEHKPIVFIFNHHEQVNEALVFQIPTAQTCLMFRYTYTPRSATFKTEKHQI